MKKMILLAGILITGAVSANTIAPGNENNKKSQNKKEMVSKNEGTKTIKTTAGKRYQCGTVFATCTSAYTCQDWTPQQWYDWGVQIQSNYCMIDSPFNP